MRKLTFTTLFVCSLGLLFVAPVSPAVGASNRLQKGELD